MVPAPEYSDREVYRRRVSASGLSSFTVTVRESDLHISARGDLSESAAAALLAAREGIEAYIAAHSGFEKTLSPWPNDPGAPEIVRAMFAAGRTAGVGPMAAVAGAVAEAVGRALLPASPEVIVENGGDIFMAGRGERVAAVFAGPSPLSLKLGLRLAGAPGGCGLCTSSGTVGPSLSLGRADAAVILAPDAALADAVATALGNRVKSKGDLKPAIDWAASVPGVLGALAIAGPDLAAWGDLELVRL
jgi:hypothetical protein